ncbi:alpha/beta fold hydrolase [Paraburkholderia sp. BR10936]|uniref:alpha/beta fold hydrolase n=1 Tax=Paraburkholderia sp. BR10936 TaxID=3236993 RepID=UPI0034D327B9
MRGAPEPVFVQSDDVRLAVYVSGPNDAPPVVLVHGYPDSARIWSAMRSELETRFRVIAYDVRGMGASEAPRAQSGYALAQLARDLFAVANATCGAQPFHLLAHDWGSIQCWEAVTDPANASRIASYTSISGPCLDHVFLKPRVPAQLLKSWYIAFFHLPFVPELAWRLGGAALWPWWLRKTERVRVEPDPRQLRNALNGLQLYRANFLACARRPRERSTRIPVQFIVPRFDRYVTPAMSEGIERWLGQHQREIIAAPHWAVVSEARQIAARFTRFATCASSRAQGFEPNLPPEDRQ